MRSKLLRRLGGLAATGYSASKKEYFHGVREHLVCTPGGRIACVAHVAGNRHDVNGLKALLQTSFTGRLYADCAYQPKDRLREKLERRGIRMIAAKKKNAKLPLAPQLAKLQKKRRAPIERRIALHNKHFHAHRTLNRGKKHYIARRWIKALARNTAIHINIENGWRKEAVAHLSAAS
jgi:hypothetical protein